jgi:uncharacterized protein YndB with AHSA1/START domain
MTTESGKEGPLSVSRVIMASPQCIYQAFLDPQAVATWRPPEGMRAHVYAFEPREGGTFRMSLDYVDASHAVRGKTSEHSDVVQGRFLELVPYERIVERIEFESNDPAFAGTMLLTTTLTAVSGGTKVTVLCQNAPKGIRRSDHETGIRSTLKNLAAFTE